MATSSSNDLLVSFIGDKRLRSNWFGIGPITERRVARRLAALPSPVYHSPRKTVPTSPGIEAIVPARDQTGQPSQQCCHRANLDLISKVCHDFSR